MLLVLFFFYSCRTGTEISIIPTLKITAIEVIAYDKQAKDSLITISLSYTDGDGDVGFPESDTSTESNLKISFFEWKEGKEQVYISPLTEDTLRFDERLPLLTPTGKFKQISGKMNIRIPAQLHPGYNPDSVVFYLQLVDRQFNKSERLRTSIIRIRH
jgi:hypothetical protein